jgi:cytochrome c-type biogenesis protein
MSTGDLIAHSPVGFVVAFGAGMASFVSPCVLPLVPSYLSLMSGLSATEMTVATTTDQRTLLRSALLFVAGFTVVFAIFEAGASALGRTLQAHQTGLTQAAGVVIIVMGLLFAGLIRPAWVMQERRFHVLPSRLGAWAPPVMGMAFAFGWTPCIGPALGAVLALSGSQNTLGRGELMLLCYSLGLGVPFIAAGVAFGRLAGVFRWVKAHLGLVNLVSGLLLAGLGILLLTDSIHRLSNWFVKLPGLNHFSV